MNLCDQILKILANGEPCSGAELGRRCQVSRTAVWKAIKKLQASGLQITADRQRGYQLQEAIELLDVDLIRSYLSTAQQARELHCFNGVDSTNTELLRSLAATTPRYCLAEQQTAGRGRRGNTWYSPFARNLYLSCHWRFYEAASALQGLSLYVAYHLVQVLEEFHPAEYKIKWPNDILCAGKKVAGILIECQGDLLGPTDAVIGIGINLSLSDKVLAENSDWQHIEAISSTPIQRNRLAAALIQCLDECLADFLKNKLSTLMPSWKKYDCLWQQPITYIEDGIKQQGIAKGIDAQGHLLVTNGSQLCKLTSGHVHTVR